MNYRYKRSWLRMCSEKEAGILGIDLRIEIGRFLGDTGRGDRTRSKMRYGLPFWRFKFTIII